MCVHVCACAHVCVCSGSQLVLGNIVCFHIRLSDSIHCFSLSSSQLESETVLTGEEGGGGEGGAIGDSGAAGEVVQVCTQ